MRPHKALIYSFKRVDGDALVENLRLSRPISFLVLLQTVWVPGEISDNVSPRYLELGTCCSKPFKCKAGGNNEREVFLETNINLHFVTLNCISLEFMKIEKQHLHHFEVAHSHY